jgi:hypothetical protein
MLKTQAEVSAMPVVRERLISKALALLKQAESVELKLTVPDVEYHSSIAALEMDVLNAELRQVIFFDTPDLKLDREGLIVRARRIRKVGDTVVKLRPIVPAEISEDLRHSAGFNLEVDALPGSVVCSGGLKRKVDNSEVSSVLQGQWPVPKLFSKAQRSLYKQYAPKGIAMAALTPLGPINVAKLKFEPRAFNRGLTAEVWFYPDSSRILELSTKCAPDEAFHVLAELRSFLTSRGISLTANQQTKTRKALEYFSHLARTKQSPRLRKVA